ncbi:MAG: tetratricopeptide repeat protein [Thermoanaerobaculia bacterium]
MDLRANHGGDGSLARALVLPLIRWEGSAEPGRLYTLVGPETFSAAVLLLDRLEQWTQNLLVGEEPGSGPASYGDSDREILPNSRLVARVSTRIHVGWTGGEARRRYAVDLPVAPSIEDVLAGRDPALERALAEGPHALDERLVASYEAAGVDAALMVWYRERTDPRTVAVSTEAPMNALAAHVLEDGDAGLAAALFALNRGDYPDSVDAWRGEAEAQLAAGDDEAARAALDRARRLAPEDPAILALEQRLND